jgi:hypothetical protein
LNEDEPAKPAYSEFNNMKSREENMTRKIANPDQFPTAACWRRRARQLPSRHFASICCKGGRDAFSL